MRVVGEPLPYFGIEVAIESASGDRSPGFFVVLVDEPIKLFATSSYELQVSDYIRIARWGGQVARLEKRKKPATNHRRWKNRVEGK